MTPVNAQDQDQLLANMAAMQQNSIVGGPAAAMLGGGTELPAQNNAFQQNIVGNLGSIKAGGTTDGIGSLTLQTKKYGFEGKPGDAAFLRDTQGFISGTGTLKTDKTTFTGRVGGNLNIGGLSLEPYAETTMPLKGSASNQATATQDKPASQNLMTSLMTTTPEEETKVGGSLGYARQGLKVDLNAEKRIIESGDATSTTDEKALSTTMLQPTSLPSAGKSETTSLKATIGTQTEVGEGLLNTQATLGQTTTESTDTNKLSQTYGVQTGYQGDIVETNLAYKQTGTTSSDPFSQTQQKTSNLGGDINLRNEGFGATLRGATTKSESVGDIASTSSNKTGGAELSYQNNGVRGYVGVEKNIQRTKDEFSKTQTDGTTTTFGASIQKPNGIQGSAEVQLGQSTETTTFSDPFGFGMPPETTTTNTDQTNINAKLAYVPKNGVGGRLDTTYGYESPQEMTDLYGESFKTGGHSLKAGGALTYRNDTGKSIWSGEIGTTASFRSNKPGNVSVFGKAGYEAPNWQVNATMQYDAYGKKPETTLMPNDRNNLRIGAQFSAPLGI